jgi:hypothetical protein
LAISVVPPLFLTGLYNNIMATIKSDGPSGSISLDTWNRLANEGNMYYGLSAASLVVAGALAINFGIELNNYLMAADLASGR